MGLQRVEQVEQVEQDHHFHFLFFFGFTETFYFKLIFWLFVFNLIYLFPGVYSLTLHSPAQACNVTYLALACHITELSKRPDQNLLWPCK